MYTNCLSQIRSMLTRWISLLIEEYSVSTCSRRKQHLSFLAAWIWKTSYQTAFTIIRGRASQRPVSTEANLKVISTLWVWEIKYKAIGGLGLPRHSQGVPLVSAQFAVHAVPRPQPIAVCWHSSVWGRGERWQLVVTDATDPSSSVPAPPSLPRLTPITEQ